MQLGCSTHSQRLLKPRDAFYAGDLLNAKQQLSTLNAKPKGDELVVELDLAMVELLSGEAASAEARLRRVRDEWDYLEQQSLTEMATSLISDDQQRAYSGEDYERMLVRVFLSLASLMQDGVDAESYSLQTLEKQQELYAKAEKKWGDNVSEHYCIPPLAPYLRGMLRESTHSNYDDAATFYRLTDQLLPQTPFIQRDIQRATSGVHSRPGHGVVYVIAMVGRGPYKVETSAPATQEALLVADQILSAVGEYSVPPTLAPVQIPKVISPPKPFELLGIEINGVPTSTTLPITDLHTMAYDSYQTHQPEVIARAVARRVIKKGAVYAIKDRVDVSSDITSFALDAAGVLWEASESADTRCWGLLPREFQIERLELPAGEHHLHLEPVASGTPVAAGADCRVNVIDGRNTYVLSYWPDFEPVGQILVSQ